MLSTRVIRSCRLNSLTCLVRSLERRPQLSSVAKLSSSAAQPSEAMPLPQPEGSKKIYSENIENLVAEISRLTLLEVADLNSALKERLNIPDAAPVAMMPGVVAAAPQQEEEDEAPAAKEVQTSFAVKLTGFEASKKMALIKFIKGCIEGFNLVQSKKFVEELPAHVKTDIGKDEAEKLKEELVALGAEAVVE